MPIIETGRLLLRPWGEGDVNSYAEMMAHPEAVRFLGHDPLDRAGAWRNLALLIGHDVLRSFTLNPHRPAEATSTKRPLKQAWVISVHDGTSSTVHKSGTVLVLAGVDVPSESRTGSARRRPGGR